jgi:hypothetical protein
MDMDFGTMVVLLVLISSITKVVKTYIEKQHSSQYGSAALRDALREVRAEMAELRQTRSDVVLSFESTVQRLEARVQHLERCALEPGVATSSLPHVAPRAPFATPVQEELPVSQAR